MIPETKEIIDSTVQYSRSEKWPFKDRPDPFSLQDIFEYAYTTALSGP